MQPDASRPASAGTSSSAAPCGEAAYGLRPGVHPAVAHFAEEVCRVVERCSEDDVPFELQAALAPLLSIPDLLAPAHREGQERTYRRHVLYADEQGRFTILAIVWRPGQKTPIHGHSAWGTVGVYEGEPNVACYGCEDPQAENPVPVLETDRRYGPGAVCGVRKGIEDAHRIYNATDGTVITIHTYGRDLVREPESINLVLAS